MVILPETKKIIINWSVAVGLATAFIVPMAIWSKLGLSDIFALPAICYLAYVGLRFIARAGTFDIFAYQFTNWVSSWRRNSPKRYEDAYTYKQVMKEKRKFDGNAWWIPFVSIGVLLLIVAVILAYAL